MKCDTLRRAFLGVKSDPIRATVTPHKRSGGERGRHDQSPDEKDKIDHSE